MRRIIRLVLFLLIGFTLVLLLIENIGIFSSLIQVDTPPVVVHDLAVIDEKNIAQLSKLQMLFPGDHRFWQTRHLWWSPSGVQLAALGDEGLWLVTPNKPRNSVHLSTDKICCMEFVDDSLLMAMAYQGQVRFWDTVAKRSVVVPNRGMFTVSSTGNVWATWDDAFVELRSLLTNRQIAQLNDVSGGVTFSPDGLQMVVISAPVAYTIFIYDTLTGNLIKHWNAEHEIRLSAFSPDGKFLATTSGNIVWLWDTKTYALETTIQADHFVDGILGIEFSPDSQKMISWSRIKVYLWNVNSGKQIAFLEDHGYDYVGSVFSPNSRLIATYDYDETEHFRARFWDAKTGKELLKLPGHYPARFSPDGTRIATVNDEGQIILWGIPTNP